MNLPNSGKTSKTPSASFAVPQQNDYAPDAGSALESVHQQARGTSPDERSPNDIVGHDHDGVNSQRFDISHLLGFIRTVSVAPAWTPRSFSEQFAIYKNGATIRLYCYDTTNGAWRYTALT